MGNTQSDQEMQLELAEQKRKQDGERQLRMFANMMQEQRQWEEQQRSQEREQQVRVTVQICVTILAVAVLFCGTSAWREKNTDQKVWDLAAEQRAKAERREVKLEAEKERLTTKLIDLTMDMLQSERQKLAMEMGKRLTEREMGEKRTSMPKVEIEKLVAKLVEQNIKTLQAEREKTTGETRETAGEREISEKAEYILRAKIERMAAKMARGMMEETDVKLEAKKEELPAKMTEENLKLAETEREKMSEANGWGMIGWTVAGGIMWLLVGVCCNRQRK